MNCIVTSIAPFAALLAAVLPAQRDSGRPAGGEPASGKTVVELAVAAGDFGTLVAAVKAAGLAGTLSGKGPFTVFAPTDAAFAKLGDEKIAELLRPENKAKLTAILTYHVAPARMPAAQVVAAKSIPTVQGQRLQVEAGEDGVRIGGARVLKTDIVGSNGVIHVIDAVLLPPDLPATVLAAAEQAGTFRTLLAAVKAAGLAETLAGEGPFTVFAPTDAAFAKLGDEKIAELLRPENKAKLAGILKLHVAAGKVMAAEAGKLPAVPTLQGQKLPTAAKGDALMIGTAKVVAADVEAGNGVVHVIDTVLLPGR